MMFSNQMNCSSSCMYRLSIKSVWLSISVFPAITHSSVVGLFLGKTICIPSFSIPSEVLIPIFRLQNTILKSATNDDCLRFHGHEVATQSVAKVGRPGKLKAFPFQPCSKLKGYA